REEMLKTECLAFDLNWIFSSGIQGPMPCEVRLRYRFQPVKCTLLPEKDGVRVVFDEPTAGAVPGQSAVFYHGDTVIGGGIIRKT
ncbi:MAG: aminomethyltransferase beta-barrel domain-containing protein, partial [Nitrospirota bacterium]